MIGGTDRRAEQDDVLDRQGRTLAAGHENGDAPSLDISWSSVPRSKSRAESPPTATTARAVTRWYRISSWTTAERVGAVEVGADRELAEPLLLQVAGEVHPLPDRLLDAATRAPG